MLNGADLAGQRILRPSAGGIADIGRPDMHPKTVDRRSLPTHQQLNLTSDPPDGALGPPALNLIVLTIDR